MSKNNRIHAINSIAERVPDAPSASLPADTSMATYGEDVFGEKEIRAFLPKATAAKLLATVNEGKPLDPSIADDVAHAMKDWALAKGATHFTHWFQPLTGGRLQLPVGRSPLHLRGARLHGVGPHEPRVHQAPRERRDALHPHRVLLVPRRGARLEDASPPLRTGA